MNKHTPGPWVFEWDEKSGEAGIMEEADSYEGGDWRFLVALAFMSGYDGRGYDHARETQIANARLIAAAPELLACVEELAAMYENTDAPIGERARAAIAKARGE